MLYREFDQVRGRSQMISLGLLCGLRDFAGESFFARKDAETQSEEKPR